MPDPGDHRIGDAERQQAIDMLRSHTGAGRLTLDEFSDLAGQVYAAQTYRELEEVGRNLPAGLVPAPAPAPAVRGATTRPPSAAPRPRSFVAVMSGSGVRGRWRAPARMRAFAFWGSVHIDLREAEIESPVVDITAWAIMGSVIVTVPPGVRADLNGLVVMGGRSNHTRADDPVPGSPLVRVHARGMWGGVSTRTKRTRAQRSEGRSSSRRRSDTERDPADDGYDDDPRADDHADRVHSWLRHGSDPRRPGAPAAPRPPAPPEPPPLQAAPAVPDPIELTRRILGDVAASLPRLDSLAPGAPSPAGPRRPSRSQRASRSHGGPGSRRDRSGADEAAATEVAAAEPSTAPSGTLTMMVTDIAGSTGLAERLGDRRWMDLLTAHNALVREQVERHGGTEIKTQGDGFIVVFRSARRAILAAVDVQRALARYRDDHPDPPLAVRIGLHTGEIVDVDGDVFGQNVVVAVRLADQAAASEIVVSALTRDLTVSGGDLSFGPADEVQLKGLSQPWRVHRVDWSPESR